jgi:hypothetical protein
MCPTRHIPLVFIYVTVFAEEYTSRISSVYSWLHPPVSFSLLSSSTPLLCVCVLRHSPFFLWGETKFFNQIKQQVNTLVQFKVYIYRKVTTTLARTSRGGTKKEAERLNPIKLMLLMMIMTMTVKMIG